MQKDNSVERQPIPTRKFWVQTTAQLLALSAFAISQPLYDVLTNSPELLTSHSVHGTELIAFCIVVSFAVPIVFLVMIGVIALFGTNWAKYCAQLPIATLFCVFSMLIFRDVISNGYIKLILSLFIGVTALVILQRSRVMQLWLCWLAVGAIAFPLLFLINPNITPLITKARNTGGTSLTVNHPVILVVFDKLPTSVLINEKHEVDSARYPNFAALAAEAHWFRNNTSSAQDTIQSVPSILTGNYPTGQKTPTLSTYPENLFTTMRHHFSMNVMEYVTSLEPVDSAQYSGNRTSMFKSLIADAALVYMHIVMPSELKHQLPSLEDKTYNFWNFSGLGEVTKNGSKRMHDFIQRIGGESQWFHYLHIDLPHTPYWYRASGSIYTRIPDILGLEKKWGNWGVSSAPIDKAFERFMQQVLLAGSLLGNLVAHLRRLNIYEESLIIVTSDHGGGFNPKDHTRAITMKNYLDVLYVPLFIKLPGQVYGEINDDNSELVDIFPTIIDLLDGHIPWQVDGVSLFSKNRMKEGKFARAALKGAARLTEFPSVNGGEFLKLQPLTDRFSRENSYADLVGRNIDDVSDKFFAVRGDRGFSKDPDLSSRNAKFEMTNGWIRGPVLQPDSGHDSPIDEHSAALIYNGKIIAITPLFTHKQHPYFAELLPEKYLPIDPTGIVLRVLK